MEIKLWQWWKPAVGKVSFIHSLILYWISLFIYSLLYLQNIPTITSSHFHSGCKWAAFPMSSVRVGSCSMLALYWLIKMPQWSRLVKTESNFSHKNVCSHHSLDTKYKKREKKGMRGQAKAKSVWWCPEFKSVMFSCLSYSDISYRKNYYPTSPENRIRYTVDKQTDQHIHSWGWITHPHLPILPTPTPLSLTYTPHWVTQELRIR